MSALMYKYPCLNSHKKKITNINNYQRGKEGIKITLTA